MANPFSDLQTALSNLGIDFTLSGIILGAVLTIALLIIVVFVLDPKGKDQSGLTLMIAAGIGVAISTAVEWFPPWIIIFIALLLAFVIFNPFSSTRGK